MSTEESPPLHDIADRILRKILEHPTNLRAFLNEVLKDLAAGFDCARAGIVPRDFLLEDWRGREADLLFEIPYRVGEDERWALICVLIEHQTGVDPRMPLRTLNAVLYWEREWRRWETMPAPRPEFRLTPIVPIVLHASPESWSSARTLADLMGGPPQFGMFAPRWEPLFWELASHGSQELLNSREAFFQLMSVVRVEKTPAEEFEPVFREAMQHLGPLHDTDRVLWTEMLSAVLTWAYSRRPGNERGRWQAVAETIQEDEQRKREIKNMGKSIGQTYFDEGMIEGELKGELKRLRKTILRLGQNKFGEPDESIKLTVLAIDNSERLEALTDRILVANSWSELLKTP